MTATGPRDMTHAGQPPNVNKTSGEVVDAALRVHSRLGPGLLERAYHVCLVHELAKRGLVVESDVEVPIEYAEVRLETGFRLDILVDRCVVVEVKAVEALNKVHFAQLLTYLKLARHAVGLLINFNTVPLRAGIHRLVRDVE